LTISAAIIDAALQAGNTPEMVAKAFRLPLSQVISRAGIRVLEKSDALLKRAKALAAMYAGRPKSPQDEQAQMAKWVDMPITYEDHPASRPFDYSRAFANTVALSRNPEADRTLGGVVQYGNREAA
jgi:hypothetical protein